MLYEAASIYMSMVHNGPPAASPLAGATAPPGPGVGPGTAGAAPWRRSWGCGPWETLWLPVTQQKNIQKKM